MPSILNLVPDLASGAVVGVSSRPEPTDLTNFSEVSGTCRVNYLYCNIKASLTATNRLACAPANSTDINGAYLHYREDTSTIARIDVLRPIIISGRFSGCAYKIFRSGSVIYCAHIARPAGTGADANVSLMASYAGQKGWEEIQHVSTMGYIGVGGCGEVMVVSQLRGRSIDTVLLAVNNAGLIVNTARTTTAL